MSSAASFGLAAVVFLIVLGTIWRSESLPLERLQWRLLCVGLWVRLCFALFVPAFQAPDEEAHFNVIRFIFEHHALPLQPTTLDFKVHDYEAYQPPLYYLMASVPYALGRLIIGSDAPGLLILVRVVMLALWWGTARITLRLLDAVKLADPALRLGVLAVVCFVPTQVYTSAAVTNDNAIVFFAQLALLCALRVEGLLGAVWLGLALGALLLSKLSGVGAFVGALGLYALCLRERALGPIRIFVRLAIAGLVVSALVVPWLARNVVEYGSLLALDRGNPTAHWPLVAGSVKVARSLAGGFWAVSGIESEIRQLPGLSFLVSCVVAVGLLATARAPDETARQLLRKPSRDFVLACALSLFVTLCSAFSFGLRSGMPHGRLLFGALVPIALAYAVGMRRVGLWLRTPIVSVALPIAYTAAFAIVTLVAMGALVPSLVTVAGILAVWSLAARRVTS